MYILYKETKYPCTASVGDTMRYYGLPEDFPAPVEEEVILCADDDFELRRDDPADYLRQTFEGGVLMLTNQPEPQPVEPVEPVEPGEKITQWDEMAEAITEGVNGV